jgi:hypothetical protein
MRERGEREKGERILSASRKRNVLKHRADGRGQTCRVASCCPPPLLSLFTCSPPSVITSDLSIFFSVFLFSFQFSSFLFLTLKCSTVAKTEPIRVYMYHIYRLTVGSVSPLKCLHIIRPPVFLSSFYICWLSFLFSFSVLSLSVDSLEGLMSPWLFSDAKN